MKSIKLNETPVRTSKNFSINNIQLKDKEIPNKIGEFENTKITNQNTKIQIEEGNNIELTYGLGDILTNQNKNQANKKMKLTIDSKVNKEIQIEFSLDERNPNLVENIMAIANEGTKSTIIIKYLSNKDVKGYHNGIIKVLAKEKSEINVIIINLMNEQTNNFLSIENELQKNAKIKYTVIDFGSKNSITNYYSNLIGDESDSEIDTIYLGKENQMFDLNYIAELRGLKTNVNIEVQGALKDNSKKHFKGTIDFKKGCKKATGNENETCMLLSDTAKSLALPMLLCSEEDVEGNHSSSAGKVGEKELFYITSRGFEEKEAMKLLIRAKFNKIIEKIKNDDIKNEIIQTINTKLD